MQDREGD